MQTHNQSISDVMHFSSGSSVQLNQTSNSALLARGLHGPPKRRGTSTSISVGDEDGYACVCIYRKQAHTYKDVHAKAAR